MLQSSDVARQMARAAPSAHMLIGNVVRCTGMCPVDVVREFALKLRRIFLTQPHELEELVSGSALGEAYM